MNKYSEVMPDTSEDLECLSEIYNLFALFDTEPANILFAAQFSANIDKYKDIFKHYNMRKNIFFSCKSNKSKALLNITADKNCGIEVSSNYELNDALKYSNIIIASGPGKEKEYLINAINHDVIISVDDIEELKQIKKLNKKTKVLLRISDLLNKVSRFGINISQLDECLNIIKNSKIEFLGFSFHINNYSLDDRISAINEAIDILDEKKIKAKYIDIGGGLPTNYCSKEDYMNFLKNNNKEMYFNGHFIDSYYPYYSEIADENALDYILRNVYKKLNEKKIELIIEPGRCLLKNVGISIYQVQYLKEISNGEKIVVTNGNINCLSEQWFQSDYLIEPKLLIKEERKKEEVYASVAGNLCLEQDMLTWRKIKFDYIPQKDDLLVYFNTAGYQMDSNESEFHKIPLVKKYIVEEKNNKFLIKEDSKYDCK